MPDEKQRAKLVVRVDLDLRNQAKAAAALAGMSLQDWVAQLIRTELARSGHGAKKTRDAKR